jgi:hypothetical protein
MKALIVTLITLVFLFTAPAFAGKSGGAGKGKHAKKQIKTHSRAMEAKADDKAVKIRKMEQKSKKTKKGLEKQREKKSEQVQKELGKGSEKGQEARETRKKWWKFFEKGE